MAVKGGILNVEIKFDKNRDDCLEIIIGALIKKNNRNKKRNKKEINK